MLRILGLIAVGAATVASVGCDRGLHRSNFPTATVSFAGRLLDADTGHPAGNVRVSVETMAFSIDPGFNIQPEGWVMPTNSVTSGGDGTFNLQISIPSNWMTLDLALIGPGFELKRYRFDQASALTRPEIRIFPALIIRPGESIDVRVEESGPTRCRLGGFPCRGVLVEASSSEPVQLEIVPHDASRPMGLAADSYDEEAVPRLTVEPDSYVYVYGVGSARLTARR